MSVDPLTKDYPSRSPYPFAMNRPIDGIDLDGLEFLPVNSAIYKQRYCSMQGLNKVYHFYVAATVYSRIPAALRHPQTGDYRYTNGGPVGAYGRDLENDNNISLIGRYYQPPAPFVGILADSPEPTNSTTGLYNFNTGAEALDRNATNSGQIASGAQALQAGTDIVSNFDKIDEWRAYGQERTQRSQFYQATNIVDNYMSAGKFADKSFMEGKGRGTMINFLVDGSLPAQYDLVTNLSMKDLEANLKTIYYGYQLMLLEQKDHNFSLQEGTISAYRELYTEYQRRGGTLNFDTTKQYDRIEANQPKK